MSPGQDYAAPGFSRDVAIFVLDPVTGKGFASNDLTNRSGDLAQAIVAKLGTGPKYAVIVSESPVAELAEQLNHAGIRLNGMALQICDAVSHLSVVYDGTRREIIVGYGHGPGEEYFIGKFPIKE